MHLFLILFPLLSACLGYLIFGKREERYYTGTLITTVIEFALALFVAFGENAKSYVPLVADFGLHLEVDGFRKVYVVIIAFMWMMTMCLSRDYFHHHHKLSRYFFFNLMTLSATMGVFLAADFYTAFVFFEVMSFTSFPWVIQEETAGAIRAACTYLAVAVIGGLTALMGIFLLYTSLGTVTFAEFYDAARSTSEYGRIFAAGLCILTGFGAKAGMFPLHIWLPKAHPVAPAPASALLSGVLTKSGIFGILGLSSYVFRYDEHWGMLILLLGTVTMFLGALLALFSIDLKRTLACSSMSQIGFILIGVGMMCLLGDENALAARGALLHMVNHSLFKLVLFMAAGVVYMNTHSLNLNEIRGFGRKKPFLMVCFLLAAAGIAGIPGLNGYISKTLLHEAIVEGQHEYGMILHVVEWIFLISGGMTLAYMTKLFVCIFVEKQEKVESAEKKTYMSPLSVFALGGSAILLPILGLSATISMDGIASFGTDFFRNAHPEHAVHYYSLENLKGGVISITIGLALYFFVVRKFLMKKGAYVDRWPKGLDLEDLLYRPVLLTILPGILGSITAVVAELPDRIYAFLPRFFGLMMHAVSDLPDMLVLASRKTIFKESKVLDPDKVHTAWSYRLGAKLDAMPFIKEKEGDSMYYAHLFTRTKNTLLHTTHNLMDSVSFALLALCVTICLVFLYILVLHG